MTLLASALLQPQIHGDVGTSNAEEGKKQQMQHSLFSRRARDQHSDIAEPKGHHPPYQQCVPLYYDTISTRQQRT